MTSDLSGLKAALESGKDSDYFLEWFWKESNGNNLIKQLNKYAYVKKLPDRIRREKYAPVVYAVVVNNFPELMDPKWRLVKVGFTHQSIEKGTNNRMEQLIKEIESETEKSTNGSAAVLFTLRIGCVDTTPFGDTEDRIRKTVGIAVKKEKVKDLNLPVPTEWVLTTQRHIDKIKQLKDDALANESSKDVMDIFKDIKAPADSLLPESLKNWVLLEGKNERRKK